MLKKVSYIIGVDIITGLSTTASDLNDSTDQLNELVCKFKLREDK
ncbi:hypothetical protein [Clostridium kluyveri]|nr:hypothetical protein [Clostridium kluyveri]UZQ48883.1 hypothetical protein OP486_12920 [Clostridium kluyveri]